MYFLLLSVAVNYARFFGWGINPNGWGSIFHGSEQHFILGQTPKIFRKFSKICIKIKKNMREMQQLTQTTVNSSKNGLIDQTLEK